VHFLRLYGPRRALPERDHSHYQGFIFGIGIAAGMGSGRQTILAIDLAKRKRGQMKPERVGI
jgi:hypothetical protein